MASTSGRRARLVACRTTRTVGGASDANFVAALGLPMLCGMGAVGDRAQAQGEYIYPDTVPAQTALVAGLLGQLAEPLRS